MEIKRNGSQPSGKGPADWFTGTVRIDPLFQANAPARASAASVTFEPGARTAWHTHPLGQTLIVTAGCGWAQREGGPIEEIRPGDVVWFAPGEKHWHGRSGDSWRADETYIKVRGQWVYLYRAVDKQGRTVDFLLSKRRDVAAAKRFFSGRLNSMEPQG